jgi:hypothetical protein
MTKVCKQCGQKLEETVYFRPYASRGRGIRASKTGFHTVCTECENFNANALRVYNKPVDTRTKADEELLSSADTLYHRLVSCGYKPVGKLAEIMLGCSYSEARGRGNQVSLPSVKYADSLLSKLPKTPDIPSKQATRKTIDSRQPKKYKDFAVVEKDLATLLERIENGLYIGDAFDMDDEYTSIWADANKDSFDIEASAKLKDLDATVSGLINTKMKEE